MEKKICLSMPGTRNLGRPVRDATFGATSDPTITPCNGSTTPCRSVSTITDFDKTAQVTDSNGAGYTAFVSGGDASLIPLLFDPDNSVAPEGTNGLEGVQRPDDLSLPNVNLLLPGENQFVLFAFATGIDSGNTITSFGQTESFGIYVSTLDAARFSIYDALGSPIASITQTPSSLDPFFLGFTLSDQPNQHYLISSAVVSFSDSGPAGVNAGIDGMVYTSVKGGAFTAPVPEPATGFILVSGLLSAIGLHVFQSKRNG